MPSPLHLVAVALDVDEVHRRAADEPGHEQLLRVVVQLLGRADLHELALVHDRDPRAHRHRLDLVVGDVHGRRPEALVESRDLGAGLDAELRVEVGQRLVHQEHGRLADDRPAERDALALAAGQLARLLLEVLEVEDPGRVLDPLVDLGLGHLAELQPEGHVVVDRHVRVQRVALEDHRDVAILRGDVVHDAVADLEVAVADLFEAGDHPQAGRLAAARRTDEDHELAIADLEVEVLDGGEVAEALPDVIERHGGHGRLLPAVMPSRALASRRDLIAPSTGPVRVIGSG